MSARREKKTTRSHTLGGCKTCRRRHVKCDKIRPTCLTCRAVGAVCEGFSHELKWVDSLSRCGDNDASANPAGHSVRQHLYTETSRASMSKALRSDLAEKPVDESLSELDARCRDVPSDTVDGLAVGPFGVFSLDPRHRQGLPRRNSPQPVAEPHAIDAFQTENALPSVESDGILSDMHLFLDWPDLFDLDLTSYAVIPQTFDNDLQEDLLGYVPAVSQINQGGNVEVEIGDSHHHSVVPKSLVSPPGDTRAVMATNINLVEAQLLLNHFKSHVISQLRIMPIERKSPWEINNLNAAIMSLARLTYMTSQPVSHAAMANLQALLALSAKHMAAQNASHNETSTEYWQSFASGTIEKAKESLQCSFRSETRGSNTAKYKDQLMAILAMLTYATLHDQQQEARAYMIDAERLLRVRGLAKRNISRKVRELHHVYTWARIVEESTFVLRNYETTGTNVAVGPMRQAARGMRMDQARVTQPYSQHQTGPNPRLDDFLRLKTPTSDSEIEVVTQKDNETGQHDIHLEDSREYPRSMYGELYGISETWLSLVSQTTRLANAIDSVEANKERSDIRFMELLERRKQRLENMICSFAAIDRQDVVDRGPPCVTRSGIEIARDSMVRALNSALVIFFYRRIRRVNPWILQEHVKNVIQALKDHGTSCRDANIQGTGSPWPAFMAGCEAMYPSQREFLTNWFDRTFAITGFARLKTAKACMEEVWTRRNQPGTTAGRKNRDQVWTWEHISKERNQHFLLS